MPVINDFCRLDRCLSRVTAMGIEAIFLGAINSRAEPSPLVSIA